MEEVHGRAPRARKILWGEKLEEERLHNLCQLEVWQVRRMPGSSSAWGGQQRLGPEIRKAKEMQWFVSEAAPWSSATLCLPASGSALLQGADTLPPSILMLPDGKTREYEGHLPVPACSASAQCLSIHRTGCSTCSPGSTNPRAPRQWYQEHWELPRLL